MGSEFQRSTAENACAPDRPVSARCLRSPWEHRNSPRTLQASVSSGSPIAKQLHIPSAWLASEEEATPVPVTPSLQYNSHEETPPRTNSPYAAADDPYYAVSPILFPHGINSESAEDRPASPGGYSKARRRQVLGNKSRFQGEGIPTASPVSFSGSPVNARCAWKQGRGTFRPSLGSLRDGQLRITGWAKVAPALTECFLSPRSLPASRTWSYSWPCATSKGPLTSGESCSDQLIEAFGCDELLPKPNFSMAREMLGHQSPQGSPSSVGSLPIEYDEEEYGFDRDIDYSQFDHLVALMPPAQFTIPKAGPLGVFSPPLPVVLPSCQRAPPTAACHWPILGPWALPLSLLSLRGHFLEETETAADLSAPRLSAILGNTGGGSVLRATSGVGSVPAELGRAGRDAGPRQGGRPQAVARPHPAAAFRVSLPSVGEIALPLLSSIALPLHCPPRSHDTADEVPRGGGGPRGGAVSFHPVGVSNQRLCFPRSRSPLRRHWRRKGPVGVSRFRRAAEAQAPVDEGQRERRYGQGAKPFVGEAASERETSGPVPSSRGRPKDPRGSSEACGPEPPSAAPPARVLPSAMRVRLLFPGTCFPPSPNAASGSLCERGARGQRLERPLPLPLCRRGGPEVRPPTRRQGRASRCRGLTLVRRSLSPASSGQAALRCGRSPDVRARPPGRGLQRMARCLSCRSLAGDTRYSSFPRLNTGKRSSVWGSHPGSFLLTWFQWGRCNISLHPPPFPSGQSGWRGLMGGMWWGRIQRGKQFLQQEGVERRQGGVGNP